MALLKTSINIKCAPLAAQPRVARLSKASRSPSLTCYAAAEEDKKLTFEPSKRAAIGFTEEDSAGQTNIFAVEPKTYVQGTSSDQTADEGSSTASSAAIAGTVAAGAIFFGLSTLSSSDVTPLEFASEYRTLSEYSREFAAELAPPPAAAPAIDASAE